MIDSFFVNSLIDDFYTLFVCILKIEQKGRNNGQSIPTKKKKDHRDKDQAHNVVDNPDADSFAMFSSSSLVSERDKEELITLREQVEDLQKKLLEKDELLKSAEMSKDQMNSVYAKLDALSLQSAEKDSMIKSIHSQLSDAKVPINMSRCLTVF